MGQAARQPMDQSNGMGGNRSRPASGNTPRRDGRQPGRRGRDKACFIEQFGYLLGDQTLASVAGSPPQKQCRQQYKSGGDESPSKDKTIERMGGLCAAGSAFTPCRRGMDATANVNLLLQHIKAATHEGAGRGLEHALGQLGRAARDLDLGLISKSGLFLPFITQDDAAATGNNSFRIFSPGNEMVGLPWDGPLQR